MIWVVVVGILYWCTVLFAAGAFFIIEMRDGDRPVGPWEWYQRLVALVVVAVGWPMVLLLGWRTSRVVPLQGKLTEDVHYDAVAGPGFGEGHHSSTTTEQWLDYTKEVDRYNAEHGLPKKKYNPHQHGEGI